MVINKSVSEIMRFGIARVFQTIFHYVKDWMLVNSIHSCFCLSLPSNHTNRYKELLNYVGGTISMTKKVNLIRWEKQLLRIG